MNLNLTPSTLDVTMESSDHRGMEITFVDGEDAPLDLTGYTLTIEGPTWMVPTLADPAGGIVLVALTPTGRDSREWRMVANGPSPRVLLMGKAIAT